MEIISILNPRCLVVHESHQFTVVWRTSQGPLYTHGWRIMRDDTLSKPLIHLFGKAYMSVVDPPENTLTIIARKARVAIARMKHDRACKWRINAEDDTDSADSLGGVDAAGAVVHAWQQPPSEEVSGGQ